MPLNIDKKYNDLLDFLGMSDYDKKQLLRTIFNRDIQDNCRFLFKEKPIYPTPKENGFLAMNVLFNHLTTLLSKEIFP